MTVMMQMLSVSKEAFNLLSTSKIAAIGIDIKVYRHSQAQNGGFLQVKYIICSRARTHFSLVELLVCILGLVLFINTMI